ncbi:hypothetical protein [Micromonospora sp. WMMD1082]|uniref:hypothetical protein n=1 Tax=Micromonospora sp. WMMD1082 TaxID=3016104 RepID=UPI002417904D|nr:hypothetical protein [Micromonospora sp. WMMD1082]MDG4792680.1 hypothetical protein [Micromonospora sp. WMMD1082]
MPGEPPDLPQRVPLAPGSVPAILATGCGPRVRPLRRASLPAAIRRRERDRVSGDLDIHTPARPTWRCRGCGAPWPCQPAKLRLLAAYKGNMPGLMVYLVKLRQEAADQLAELDSGTPPADLHVRFTDWIPADPSK